MRALLLRFITLLILCILPADGLICLAQSETAAVESPAAVVYKGQRLFVYYASLEGMTPAERARRTAETILKLADDPKFQPSRISVVETPDGTSVSYDGTVIATASIEDAKLAKDSTHKMAREFAGKLRHVLRRKVEELTAARAAAGIAISLAVVVILLFSVILICRVASYCCNTAKRWKGTFIRAIKIQEAEFISAEMMCNLLVSVTKFIQFFSIVILVYLAVLIILESFPNTRDMAATIRETSLMPLTSAVDQVLGYFPKLFVLLLIAIFTYGAMAFNRFFFDAIEAGSISFDGFDRDWAQPTEKLVRLFIIAFALVLALPYLPGWESDAFKQVGLFFGLLLSLGSTQVIGHIMGGTVLTYTNAFKVGDRIKVSGHVGDVIDKSLFVTRLRTPKNEVVSLPNGQVVSADIVNYSNMAATGRLILYTSITIGYDAAWKSVRDLLISAAKETPGIVEEPEPFVLVTSLNDFTVTYEINAHTDLAHRIPETYSQLHKAILNRFNEAGVEIMSPHIFSLRDGNDPALPPDNVASDYQTKFFRVTLDGGHGKT